MAEFKRKPLPDELTAALRAGVRDVPAAVPDTSDAPSRARGRAPKTVQVNFNASEQLARIIAKEAVEAGSTRRFFARMMKDRGYDVPEADLNPHDNRRRWAE